MSDLRIHFDEEMVGSEHPTKPDTLNRLVLGEHNPDGTHDKVTRVTDPWIDVRAYGAAGDGATDDTAAVGYALQAAVDRASAALGSTRRSSPRLHFPAGTYLVGPEVFSGFTGTDVRTLRITGEGWYNSSVVLSGDGALFKSDTASKALFWVFSDIGFYGDAHLDTAAGDPTDPVSDDRVFLWFNAPSGLQGFKFVNVMFSRFGRTHILEGENNESEIKFFNCKVVRNGTWLTITNNQALNIEHFGCDVEQYAGSLVSFPASDVTDGGGTAGGGSVRFYGGSVIPFDAGSAKFLIDVKKGSATYNLPTVKLDGVRAELRYDNNGIANIDNSVNSQVVFRDSAILTAHSSGGTKKMASVGAFGELVFDNCTFATSGTSATEQWELKGSAGVYGNNGLIRFDGCKGHPAAEDVTEDTTDGTNVGMAVAVNSRETEHWATSEVQETRDWTYTGDWWRRWGRSKIPAPVHRSGLMRQYAPYNDTMESTATLPPNSTISRVVGYIPPQGACNDPITYTLEDGSGVGLFTINAASQKDGTYFEKTPADFSGGLGQARLGTATADRTLVFRADANSNHQPVRGWGYIEYY